MVADVDRVVAHDVERRRERMRRGTHSRILASEEAAEGISLDGVAIVDQYHRLGPSFSPDPLHDAGQMRQPGLLPARPGPVPVIVPVQDGAMDIGGGQHGQSRHEAPPIGRREPIA